MELRLERTWVTPRSIIGTLFVDGVRESVTLEPSLTTPVHPGFPAIPAGRYRVVLTPSERVQRGELWSPREDHALPLLLDVPRRDGIRAHAGNKPEDTKGCLLVGATYGLDYITESRTTLIALLAAIEQGILTGRGCFLTILNADPEALA